jgi:polysaccharide export outer membrane protein
VNVTDDRHHTGHQARDASTWRQGALLALPLLLTLAGPAAAGDYKVGPQDKLKIRVFEWRPLSGAAYEWTPLVGEFVVSAGGNLSLPLVGAVPVEGRTTEEVASDIGARLKTQIGLQTSPVASVEVSEFRPFFVTGLVSKPGRYSYAPGLTVVQALSMAGGTFGPAEPNLIALQRDAVNNRGELRALEVERLGLLARQARLDAVLAGKAEVAFPPDLLKKAGRPAVDRMLREEQALFDARLHSMTAEIDALTQAKKLALNQVDTLNTKADLLAKQSQMANKELAAVNKLATQGLTASSRQFGAVQDVSDLESRSLDTSLALLKAQQDAAAADRDMIDLRNRYRVDALTEAAEVRARLAENEEKAGTAEALLTNAEVQAPSIARLAADDDQPAFNVFIDRSVNGAATSDLVGDNDLVEPGDVLRVEKRRRDAPAATASIVPLPAPAPH